ncbi:MAG: UDP-N-acetylmuramoyl-tripeptide--D-alanyl-D-alanine ligase [Leeuwenhoekiella sp.]
MEIKELHQLYLESSGIATDTRKIAPKTLFFALKGDNFNGNAFASQALEAGANYVIIDEEGFLVGQKTILVKNALETLQQLASFHRKYLKTPIIALTGSNGKTTTKELINAVLSQKFKTIATAGNLNNHIGVPLTLLKLKEETEIGIIEMGANHPGEIAALAQIADPDYGYITNFGKAHLEGFGSEEGVIKAKSELYDYLRQKEALVFINSDDPKQIKQVKGNKTYSFGHGEDSDFAVAYLPSDPYAGIKINQLNIKSNLIGSYNATNIAAAAAIGKYFEVSEQQIKEAIINYIPANNRSQIIKKGSKTIILDAYNANPTSMEAALKNFKDYKAESKTVILGDMFELGETANIEHTTIANLAISMNFDKLILLGKNFRKVVVKSEKVWQMDDFEAFKAALENFSFSIKEESFLIKGSRGMALERIIDIL